jgi:hypothetical protein
MAAHSHLSGRIKMLGMLVNLFDLIPSGEGIGELPGL